MASGAAPTIAIAVSATFSRRTSKPPGSKGKVPAFDESGALQFIEKRDDCRPLPLGWNHKCNAIDAPDLLRVRPKCPAGRCRGTTEKGDELAAFKGNSHPERHDKR